MTIWSWIWMSIGLVLPVNRDDYMSALWPLCDYGLKNAFKSEWKGSGWMKTMREFIKIKH